MAATESVWTLIFGTAGAYLQLARFFIVLIIGIVLTRAVLMPIVRKLASRRNAGKKTRHSLENIVGIIGIFIAFTAALQAGQFGSLVTVIGTVAGAATVAIGWGMRDQVGSVVSGIFIHLYPSFVKGDYISVGEVSGIVKEITLVETRLRDDTGEKLVIPNNYITTRPLVNQSKGTLTQDSIEIAVRPEKLDAAEKELKRIAEEYDEVLNTPAPKIMHTDITDGNVVTELIYYLRDNQDIKQIRSNVIQMFNEVAVEKDLLSEPEADEKSA